VLQETHLNEDHLNNIKSCFNKNFEIFNSCDPDNPCGVVGVAIILNKAYIAPEMVQIHVLTQGRAIMMKLKWAGTEELLIISIYAPNRARQHLAFWTQLDQERRRKRLLRLDFVAGDFNLTEDLIDRDPPTESDIAAIEALRVARLTWNTQDQWCHDNPNGRLFTHKHISDHEFKFA